MIHRRTPFLLLPLLVVACGGSTGEFGAPRTLPKDQRPTQWDVAAPQRLGAQQMGRAPAPGGAFTGTTPAGWETQPPQPARFRDLVWRIAGDASTECYFTARTGGGVTLNLNRWYNQFGMPPASAEGLPAAELAGTQGRLLELQGSYNGTPGQGMMLVFTADGDSVTTLKFTGPEAVVKSNREQFLELARSLRPGGEAPPHPGGSTGQQPQMPAGHPPTPSPNAANASAPFTATVPSGWTSKPSTKALHHTFGADGEVYVAQLGGDVRAMWDIWRGEVGQTTKLTDDEAKALPVVPMLGGEGQLLDVRGDWQGMSGKKIAGARMLVAARLEGGAITFVKLVGKAADVETQVEPFQSFCNSLRRAP